MDVSLWQRTALLRDSPRPCRGGGSRGQATRGTRGRARCSRATCHFSRPVIRKARRRHRRARHDAKRVVAKLEWPGKPHPLPFAVRSLRHSAFRAVAASIRASARSQQADGMQEKKAPSLGIAYVIVVTGVRRHGSSLPEGRRDGLIDHRLGALNYERLPRCDHRQLEWGHIRAPVCGRHCGRSVD